MDLDSLLSQASAGASSFRRQQSLHKHLKRARHLVENLKRKVDEDPDASNRCIKAVREQAARECEQRVTAALAKLAKLQAERQWCKSRSQKEEWGHRVGRP